TVLDTSDEALKRGLGVLEGTYDSMVKRGRLSPEDKAKRMGLIKGTTNYADLSEADVIIEAVFENMELKKKIFAELDKVAKPGCVLATNTSTLDVEKIGAATKRPQDVIG
ncbi:MAG: 3-hydroxyacyl-CoA dehydrogenase, partial [Hyphomicrobiales bacterium]|nr:3-hydroxyacyl-CoA dehydrogenase [Hyphomicrobiales bacterium]